MLQKKTNAKSLIGIINFVADLCPCRRLIKNWSLTHSFRRSQRLNVFVPVTVGESLHVDVTHANIFYQKSQFLAKKKSYVY